MSHYVSLLGHNLTIIIKRRGYRFRSPATSIHKKRGGGNQYAHFRFQPLKSFYQRKLPFGNNSSYLNRPVYSLVIKRGGFRSFFLKRSKYTLVPPEELLFWVNTDLRSLRLIDFYRVSLGGYSEVNIKFTKMTTTGVVTEDEDPKTRSIQHKRQTKI